MRAAPSRSLSSWHIQKVVAQTRSTLDDLINNHGLILDSDDDVLAALDAEYVDARRVLRSLGLSLVEAKANAAVTKIRLDDLTARRNRYKSQQERLRSLILLVMEEACLRSFPDPEFSLSKRDGLESVEITDVDALDEDLVVVEVVTTKKPKIDEIRQRLKAQIKVDGAVLGDAEPILTLRTK